MKAGIAYRLRRREALREGKNQGMAPVGASGAVAS
jgi:hypothetical protein